MLEGKNVIVEVILPDGSMSMFLGEIVEQTPEVIVLDKAAWIASTGRRHLFFAGKPDEHVEVEPYPDGMLLRLPARPVIVTDWPYPLIREAR